MKRNMETILVIHAGVLANAAIYLCLLYILLACKCEIYSSYLSSCLYSGVTVSIKQRSICYHEIQTEIDMTNLHRKSI